MLETQADQINRIQFGTQDENLHFILSDARNGSNNMYNTSQEINTQGRGIMYRIVDLKKFFVQLKKVTFGFETFNLKLRLIDSFLKENDGIYYLEVKKGKIKLVENKEYDIEIEIDIAGFSSMVVGSINFNDLVRYGLVKISDLKFINKVNNTFTLISKPICMTYF